MRTLASLSRASLAVLFAASLFAACAPSGSGAGIGDGEIAGTPEGGTDSPYAAAGSFDDGAAAPTAGAAKSSGPSSTSSATSSSLGEDQSEPAVQAGVLTTGAWDDNRNFDLFLGYRSSAASVAGAPPFTEQEHRDAYAIWSAPRAPKTTLDVSLVVDTTGSMDDEIAYLSAEFSAMHDAIEARYPNADQRWSVVFYKDVHDPYIVKWFDFRADAASFEQTFQGITAGGGDDYPESPERALAIDAELSWRDDATAKLAFWVTDAPHHEQDAGAMADAVRALEHRGVHVYPIAASGADDLTELTMRSAAQLTGGRFLFLTDDSGVGDSHEVPRVPCFFVTKLDDAILRMVDVELSGEYREPTAAEVIRTGGNPTSGRCVMAGGGTVNVF